MLESILIERFRGIERGELRELGALTVLTGPNGSGKTTVMEAGLLATSGQPATALAELVNRRAARGGARWVAQDPFARIAAEDDDTSAAGSIDYRLERFDGPDTHPNGLELVDVKTSGLREVLGQVAFTEDNEHHVFQHERRENTSSRWVDPYTADGPATLYSTLVRSGRKTAVLSSLARALPQFTDIEILTEPDGEPQLYVVQEGRGIPLGLAGDGVAKLVSMAMHVASAGEETVFIEEPENYLHPRAMVEAARIMWDAVDNGAQLVLSTHSLEFIDALVAEASTESIDRLKLFNLSLEGGLLTSSRLSGRDVELQRNTIASDLR